MILHQERIALFTVDFSGLRYNVIECEAISAIQGISRMPDRHKDNGKFISCDWILFNAQFVY